MPRLPWIEMLLLFGLGFALIVQPHPPEPPSSADATSPRPWPDHSALDPILKAAVVGDRVDYALVRDKYAALLNGYLDQMAYANLDGLPQSDLLAYYLNVYNATMIRAVLDRGPEHFSPRDNDFAIFKTPLVRLPGGKVVSLNQLENDIIRPTFRDPRVHVALNCAARSCPPLLNRAYRGEDLDATLDANMKRFLTDPARNQVDDAKKELHLSRIFDWYAADFGGKDAIPTFVGKILGRDLTGYTTTFLEYDWTLNALAPQPPAK